MSTLILSPTEEKAAMRNIIWSQCLAIVALGTVGNGTLLLYLTAIGTSAVRTMIYLGSIHFLLGGAMGAIGIAMTTELLGVLPKENKSVAASMFIIFQTSGVALSGLIPAGILKANILLDIWEIGGHQLSSFDAILAGYKPDDLGPCRHSRPRAIDVKEIRTGELGLEPPVKLLYYPLNRTVAITQTLSY